MAWFLFSEPLASGVAKGIAEEADFEITQCREMGRNDRPIGNS
jgi:hypothetical protein